jgi:CheY-like chemotaxis protein
MKNIAHAKIAARHNQGIHKPRMVLVVEDDCAVRELFMTILDYHGYKALSAGSASEALAVVKAWEGEPIDLLITDLSLPCKNGDDLAVELCALLPKLKVIYSSGHPADDPFPMSLDSRHAVYLPKPVTPHTMQRAIQALFEAPPSQAAA